MPSRRTGDRELASDRRAGSSARTSIRKRRRATVKEQWRSLAALAAATRALFVVAAVFATGPLQRGFILGSGAVITVAMAAALAVLTSGTAPLTMGELAEQWTAQEVRPLQEHGWRLINHFGLGTGDYDHVLVGPGGVVLVETKWGGTPWDVDARDLAFRLALEQTARNAKQLAMCDGVVKHGRPQVEPVLAVWGPAGRRLRDAIGSVPNMSPRSGTRSTGTRCVAMNGSGRLGRCHGQFLTPCWRAPPVSFPPSPAS
jgi:hypothetical protein